MSEGRDLRSEMTITTGKPGMYWVGDVVVLSSPRPRWRRRLAWVCRFVAFVVAKLGLKRDAVIYRLWAEQLAPLSSSPRMIISVTNRKDGATITVAPDFERVEPGASVIPGTTYYPKDSK